MTTNNDDDYKVGYGKPPAHTRFKSGQSGNPKGRKSGTRSFKEDLSTALNRKVTIREGGKEITLTMQQLIIKTALTQAAKGDRHARPEAIALIMSKEGVDGAIAAEMTASDKEMIRSFYERNFPGEKK